MSLVIKTHDHAALVESIAKELKEPVDEVRALYESELTDLRAQARVETYVPIFASRKVRAVLRGRRHKH